MAKLFKLYRHYDALGELLYVGISTNIASRLAAHRTYSIWFDKVTTIKIETYENIEKLRAIEKQIIENEKPVFNLIYSTASRKEKPTDSLNIAELADYLCVPKGRIQRDICLKRFIIKPDTEHPFTWFKGNIDDSLLKPEIESHIEKMRLK